jgi:predicted dehydrogenase
MVNLRTFLKFENVQIVAVCDVDQVRRDRASKVVNEFYANTKKSGTFDGCKSYEDFREVIARDDVDAVILSTPDHWHALPVIAAANAKKNIYCEKPLGLTVEQGRVMSDVIKKNQVVFQAGTQLRSSSSTRLGCELVRNGYLGKIEKVVVGTPRGKTLGRQPGMPIPAGFNFDMWLGPAPLEEYTERRCHGTFRFISDYSGGEITDHGAHYIDIAQWGLGTELTGPLIIEGQGAFPHDGLYDTATSYEVRCTYQNGVQLIISSEVDAGTMFIGTEGKLLIQDGGIQLAEPANLKTVSLKPSDIQLYKSDDHHRNFLDCIASRKETISPVEHAHRTATIAHLGNIAIRLKRKLRWDPQNELLVQDDEANRMLSRFMREPWSLVS